jgi:hypothetical protein
MKNQLGTGIKLSFWEILLLPTERLGSTDLCSLNCKPTGKIYSKKYEEGNLYLKRVPDGLDISDVKKEIPFEINSWSVIDGKLFTLDNEPKPFGEIIPKKKIIYFSDIKIEAEKFLAKFISDNLEKENENEVKELVNGKIAFEIIDAIKDESPKKILLYKIK